MTGLQRICKMYGSMKVGDAVWVWDYANDKPRLKKDMTLEEIKASERAKWESIAKEITP